MTAAPQPQHPATGVWRTVGHGVQVLLADNPGPMTLDGTNSYLIRGEKRSVVVDPGPDDAAHLDTLAAAGPALVLITHRHVDHTAGSPGLRARTGAPVRAVDPEHCHGGDPLTDGETVDLGGRSVRVLATPGHTSDSVSFEIVDAAGDVEAVLTGDTILGRGTTVLAPPDGDLGDYLDSLDRLAAVGRVRVLPAHGPDLPDMVEAAAAYRAHREQRLDQIRAALAVLGPDAGVAEVTDHVYTDIDPSVRGAAEMSVRAQLDFLAARR
ncbi:MBL fold metallo-hydrolase [Nakamurella sp. YIM 132087]|uniref:MBL fold metallo-hydrolase n=1 Tax=Nakamurella alba TaxID=2665158 RepID=A0A7K1FSF1_9ACTN|nr:MBL fold metallo-hydrolase [Nakamurella alba]MTD17066.1 MBL fold metallo-hydrolase [Nakamurella alba]